MHSSRMRTIRCSGHRIEVMLWVQLTIKYLFSNVEVYARVAACMSGRRMCRAKDFPPDVSVFNFTALT